MSLIKTSLSKFKKKSTTSNLNQESMALKMITMTPLQDFRFIYDLFTITRAKMEN